MFKRISIFLIVLLTVLCFVSGVSATDAGLFIKKDAAGTYIDYVDADGTSIMLIDDTDGVTIATEVVGNTYTSMIVTSTTDASSLTAASIVTAGGIACADELWLGDDIDMSTNGTGVYEITLNDAVADALSITREGTDIIVFDTSTPRVTITPVTTITGLLTSGGGITVGADDAGFDVTFYGENSGSDFVWDQDGDTDASLTLGTTGGTKGVDFKVYGEASGTFLHWDRNVDDLLLGGAVTRLIISGTVDTSLTDASIVTSGGIACTKQLWLGDDLDMSTSATGVYELTLRDTVDDALSIVAGVDLMLFDTDTDQITFTPEVLFKDDLDLTTSTTGVYELTLNADQADALSICDSTGDLIEFDTTTGILTTTISTFVVMGTESVGIATTTANPFTVEVHTEPLTTLTAGATGHSAGIRSRYHVTVAQANTISICAVEARLRVKHALADGIHSAISGVIEASTANADFTGSTTTVRSAGFFALDFDALGSLADDGWLTGVTIDSSVDGGLSMGAVQFAGLRITGGSTKEDWEQGIVIDDSVAVTGIHVGTCSTMGINIASAEGMLITSTITTASTYPFEVAATLATNTATGGYVGAYFTASLSGNTDVSGSAGYRTIRSILSITGHTSSTALSSTGCFSAVEGRYYTDNTDGIAVSNGIHAALAGLMKAGQYYVLSGPADYCGLAILDSTHASATIDVTKYSGILIGNVTGGTSTMGNAIKVGSNVTNFLEIPDDDAIASLDGNIDTATNPDGFVRISVGGQPCWLWVYRSNPTE